MSPDWFLGEKGGDARRILALRDRGETSLRLGFAATKVEFEELPLAIRKLGGIGHFLSRTHAGPLQASVRLLSQGKDHATPLLTNAIHFLSTACSCSRR